MPEPTITQNSALYLLQHKPMKRFRLPRPRWLSVKGLRDMRVQTFGDMMDVRRLPLGQR